MPTRGRARSSATLLWVVGGVAAGFALGVVVARPSDPGSAPVPATQSPAPRATQSPAPRASASSVPDRSRRPAATRTRSPSPTPQATRTEQAGRLRILSVIDGDTVVAGSVHVRLLGIDTPEAGECGFDRATAFTQRFLRDGGRITNRSGGDRYGRLLAYVSNAQGRDLGAAEIHRGLANARYDSTDGYDWHPHEPWYRRLDARRPHVCGQAPDALGGP